MKLKQRIYEIIERVNPDDQGAIAYETCINLLVLVTVITIFLGTFSPFATKYAIPLGIINAVVVIVFTFDYIFRVWTASLKYPKLSPAKARRKYMLSGFGIIDALATFPPYISFFFSINLNVFKLFRLLRLFKLEKMANAMTLFTNVFKRKQNELIMVFSLVFMLIYVCAILMFYVENAAQPDVFSDAGKSMWWAVITLTTIGYGDMFPITPMGHFLGGLIALLGIGVIALPTGILSSGLMEELTARKEALEAAAAAKKPKGKTCPHCGKQLK